MEQFVTSTFQKTAHENVNLEKTLEKETGQSSNIQVCHILHP